MSPCPPPSRQSPLRPLHQVAAVLLVAALGGCDASGSAGAPPAATPPSRPDDGLLRDTVLQGVVELQVRRDGAALGALLDDSSAAVRSRAAFALASVQDQDQVPALLPLLDDPDPGVRRDAAFALGQMGDPAATDPLLESLAGEEDAGVIRELLTALGRVGGPEALQTVATAEIPPEAHGNRALAIARFGIRGVFHPEGLSRLVEGLTDPRPELRERASYFFARIRQPQVWAPAANDVRRALDGYEDDDPAAMHLLLAVGGLGDPGDNGRLLRGLEDGEDWRIRTNAARAMGGRIQDPEVLDAVMEALDDPSTHVAVAAAGALASTPNLPPAAVERIREWVVEHPDDWRVSGSLLIPLAVQGETELVRSWLRNRADAPERVRARGLGALGAASGEDVTEELMEAVREESPGVGVAALRSLTQRWRFFREDTATHGAYYDVFTRALRSGDVAMTYTVAPVLADSIFREMGSLEELRSAYRDMSPPGDVEPMTAILGALGAAGDRGSVPLMREALESGYAVIRRSAAGGLEQITGEAVSLPEVESEAPERAVDWAALAELGSAPRLVLETNKGKVVLRLDPEEAPLTVQTIAGFVREGRYDGVPFHRVEPNFVVQGGDFARGDGFGGPGFDITSEFTLVPYLRGSVGMASAGKDTEGSQFFVTHSLQPHLDGSYTTFGWVVEGMDAVDRIYEGDAITRATVEPGG